MKGPAHDLTTSQDTPSPAASISTGSMATPSPEVSAPTPTLHLSPVLQRYREYLQSYYKARALAPADKFLPTMNAPYIDLAMVSKTLYKDGIHQYVSPLRMEDLLSPVKDKQPVKFVLVEGPPGMGKSTFAWEVCRRWDEILRNYHAVVLLKLREKWVLNATSLADLFRYPSEPQFSSSIAAEFDRSQGRTLLLVLDGFDEVSHNFHQDSAIVSILRKQLLPACTIILTTRSSAKSIIHQALQPRVDKNVEIIGFTEKKRVQYITEVFSEKPELHARFLKYMFLVPHIKSMMYTPLNCAIIARVYFESQNTPHLSQLKTRTQLYRALTHSLLARHINSREGFDFECMLPEGLRQDYMEKFKVLAKFAFDSYHHNNDSPRKVPFFNEDIPKGLDHFGFMNESTEMYASKGVERTFSFIHLSLQEYLAAWHLAHSYSIEFQVAYHGMAVMSSGSVHCLFLKNDYKGSSKEEEALIASLQSLSSALEEPAIFLSGINGCRFQSQKTRSPWYTYLSTSSGDVFRSRVLLRSLYEAQNPLLLRDYFAGSTRSTCREVTIGSWGFVRGQTQYECYALSYCLAHCSDQLHLKLDFSNYLQIFLLQSFVKGLLDSFKSTSDNVKSIDVNVSVERSNDFVYWLTRANKCFSGLEKASLSFTKIDSDTLQRFLQPLSNLQSLVINMTTSESWEWLSGLKSLTKLEVLNITSKKQCNLPPVEPLCWLVKNRLTKAVLDIKIPSTPYDIGSPTALLVDSVMQSVMNSNQISEVELPNVSRETMVGVRHILLMCPNLTTLKLKRTRLGYEGILYICSALTNSKTSLKFLEINDLCLPPKKRGVQLYDIYPVVSSFSLMDSVPLPSKITCTDFLLKLNNILRKNTTLEKIVIQSGVFRPVDDTSIHFGGFTEWTGLGPLQQFNMGVIRSGVSHNLRRSFSSSDITRPQTQLYWWRNFVALKNIELWDRNSPGLTVVQVKKSCPVPLFTAPDNQVLQFFSGLDLRLRECLGILNLRMYAINTASTGLMLFNRDVTPQNLFLVWTTGV